MRRVCAFLSVLACAVSVFAGDRVPREQWMSYADPAEAGFDAADLEAARATWEGMPSSAFMVVSAGAIVAAWGDVDRRLMCHSVRKSFMSALYGIYWDRGQVELNKTLEDLGIDDQDDVLLESEKQARILDLLKARSGIFHPAAYAGRTDSQPAEARGPAATSLTTTGISTLWSPSSSRRPGTGFSRPSTSTLPSPSKWKIGG